MIMVDTKGRTVENDEADKTSGGTQEAERELKESIRLNTFKIYSLQEMQDILDKDYAVIVYGNPLHNRVSKKKMVKLNPLDFYYDVEEVQ